MEGWSCGGAPSMCQCLDFLAGQERHASKQEYSFDSDEEPELSSGIGELKRSLPFVLYNERSFALSSLDA